MMTCVRLKLGAYSEMPVRFSAEITFFFSWLKEVKQTSTWGVLGWISEAIQNLSVDTI